MLGASASTEQLVQRLRARVAQIIAGRIAARTSASTRRGEWYSASTLWPDMFAGAGDGK
jgi:hypothetical protein